MSVKCKFRVSAITIQPHWVAGGKEPAVAHLVVMHPVQSEPFGQATPNGQLQMLIVNPEAANQFEINAEYELTFQKVSDGIRVFTGKSPLD